MEKKTYPSGVITPELGSTNWYSDYDTNSSLLDSNITKTNNLDSKVKELETSYTNVETSLTSLSAVAKSGDYNDLSNKPESIALAEKAVADGDNNVITKTYATKKEVVTSLEPYIKKTELADVATSGSYTDLSDKPTTIAHADRATADNNGDVITVTYAKKTEIPNLDGYALSKDISKVGKTNNYKDLDNLPKIPSLDGYVTNVELSPVAKSGDYNDLSNTPEPVDLTPYATKKELGFKADDANVVHKSGTETIAGTKTFSSQIKGNITGTSSDVVVGSDTATARGYLVDNVLPKYTWEEGSQAIAGRVPLITDFNNLTKPGVYHVIFCLNDGFVYEEKEYKESLNRPSIPNITTGFRDGILEIKETTTTYDVSSYHRLTQKITLLSGNSNYSFNGRTYQRVCLNTSNNVWTAWKRVAIDEEVVHTSGAETIAGTKTFSGEVQTNTIKAVGGGANITLTPPDNGGFAIRAFNGTTNKEFVGYPSGMLAWDNNEILTRVNGVTLGTEQTISGVKTFSDVTYYNKELRYRDTKYDWTDTSLETWCDAGHVVWSDKTGNRRMHELVGTKGGVWRKAYYINEYQYFGVDSNRNIAYSGTTFTWNSANILTDNNQIMVLKNLTGALIAPGAVIDCGTGNGLLAGWYMEPSGSWALASNKITGKWKNASIYTVGGEHSTIFVKVG